jgi:NAD(P)H-hydrate epimerase
MNPTSPTLNRAASRDIDRRAIRDYGMTGLVLMENAGRGVVDKLEELGIDGPVAIVCGKGNNAGDGFVMARHLDLRGYSVCVLLCCDPQSLVGDARANYQILTKSKVDFECFFQSSQRERVKERLENAAWLVDALLGTGSRGTPRAPLDEVIEIMNQAEARKLAVDVPSGLDCETGRASRPTFRADHTCTFVAAKSGFYLEQGAEMTGAVHVLDIGVPRRLVEEVLARTIGQ